MLEHSEIVKRLLQIEISDAQSDQPLSTPRAPFVMPRTLHLQRIWPHLPDHFGLAYVDEQGRHFTGQWLADGEEFQRLVKAITRATTIQSAGVLPIPALGVLIQIGGADRKLPGLASLLAQPDAELIVHHPERRAVVRLATPTGSCYAKVVRPARVAALATTLRTMEQMAASHFATPNVLAVDETQGVIHLALLAGIALYARLDREQLVAAAQRAGATLRSLHTLAQPDEAVAHTALDEVKVLQRWQEHLARVAPGLLAPFQVLAEPVCAALTAGVSSPVLLHRDFYDKQVFWDETGSGAAADGLLDFDTLAVGEASLDLANALVHFELRALQGACLPELAQAAAAALVTGYAPDSAVRSRMQVYADATRLRLACVYACRPAEISLSPLLFAQVGRPLLLP